MTEFPRKRKWLRRWKRFHLAFIVSACFLLFFSFYVWTELPPPYNFRYRFNLWTRDATFVCRDGLYSWSATPQGACSGHGGIRVRLK